MSVDLSVVIPAYNEEAGLERVVRGLDASLRGTGRSFEILVVDDGSTDDTARVAGGLGVRVLTHSTNRGYGAALKTGIKAATGGRILICDGDGTYPAESIPLLLETAGAHDMVVAARTGPQVAIGFFRRLAKTILRRLAVYLSESPIPDLNSGLRAMRRDLVLAYRPILPDGFSFTTTITLAALTNGHRVDWVSIDYRKRRGSSKIRPVRDTLGFAGLIVRTVLYFNPLKVFFPVAAVIGMGLLASLWYDAFVVSPANLSEKTVLLFVALVQVLSVGLLADLVDKRSRL